MASLLNKLTGHNNDSTKTHTDNTHNAATSAANLHNNNALNNTSTTTTTTQQTTTTGSNPYGASGTMNTGAAYTSGAANTNMANTHSHTTTGYSHQGSSTTMGDDAITRSEEQLRVGKERVQTGKAELNKYVTTEHVEQAVPVQKERVVIEREPITEANRGKAMSGPAISEAHYETNLSEERVAATKETVPIERIRLAKQVETTVQNVGADLRKEHVDFTHSKLSNDSNINNTNNMTTNAGVPHTKY